MNQTVKTGLVTASFVLAGVTIFNYGSNLYGKYFGWSPTAETAPLVFQVKLDKEPAPAFALNNDGTACQNIPLLFKAWEMQVKQDAANKAAQAKAGKSGADKALEPVKKN